MAEKVAVQSRQIENPVFLEDSARLDCQCFRSTCLQVDSSYWLHRRENFRAGASMSWSHCLSCLANRTEMSLVRTIHFTRRRLAGCLLASWKDSWLSFALARQPGSKAKLQVLQKDFLLIQMPLPARRMCLQIIQIDSFRYSSIFENIK